MSVKSSGFNGIACLLKIVVQPVQKNSVHSDLFIGYKVDKMAQTDSNHYELFIGSYRF